MGGGGLPWVSSFSSGKRAQGEHPASAALGGASWEARLSVASRGSLWESVGLNHWGSHGDGGDGGVYSSHHSDLGRSPSCFHPAAHAISRAKLVTPSGQRAQLAVLTDLVPSEWAVFIMEPILWVCRGREANSKPHPTAEHNVLSCLLGGVATDAQ